MKSLLITLAVIISISSSATAQDNALPRVVSEHSNVQIAAQPDVDQLQDWIDAGTTLVISVRTAREMSELPFDEAAILQGAGVAYAHIPTGYETGYSTSAIDAISTILAAHDGPVVLHCTVGWRAAHVYTAHLIETGVVSPEGAESLGLSPNGELSADVMRDLSPRYAEAFPAE